MTKTLFSMPIVEVEDMGKHIADELVLGHDLFWTDTMIEDATFVPCGPLLEGDDIGERITRTRRWWAALLGTNWLDG